jgi:hypothetical protein
MRKKLRLALDALTVESFEAVAEPKERGTVAGCDLTSPDDGRTGARHRLRRARRHLLRDLPEVVRRHLQVADVQRAVRCP